MVRPDVMKKLRTRKSLLTNFKAPRVDFRQLKNICKRPIKDFHVYQGIGNFEKVNTPNGPYFYRDNGAKILVVAHLDSVQDFHWSGVLSGIDDTTIHCTTLDNRLGVYVALETLSKAGLEYDILLTTNEEQGDSTSQSFEPPKGKKYNWIVSFDRRGEDVVLYQYDNLDFRRALISSGFKVGAGTYSCIKDLSHLGVSGVNIGVGMYSYHYTNAYASLNEIRNQVSRFLDFYHANYNIEYEYLPKFNTVSKNGFSYTPYVVGRFNDTEMEEAIDIYEHLQNPGVTLEAMGYSGTVVTKQDMANKRHPKGTMLNRGSEDVQQAIIFPMPLANTSKQNKEDLKKQGLDATIVERCIECGKHFEVAEANTEVFCEECKEVMANRHYEKSEDAYREVDVKDVNKSIITSIMSWLDDVKDNAPQKIGASFKSLRERGISEESAKRIFTDLVTAHKLKKFRSGKAKVGSNWPAHPSGKVVLTQKGMAALMDKVGVDTSEVTIPNAKWLSKLESGHEGFWAWPREAACIEDYTLLLRDYVDDEWMEVIDKIDTINLHEIVKARHEKMELWRQVETKVDEKAKPLIKIGIKFKLDASNKDWNFTTSRNKAGKIETSWERVKEKKLENLKT